MSSFRLTLQARLDPIQGYERIARSNPAAAERWKARMSFCLQNIAQWPTLGKLSRLFSPRPLYTFTEQHHVMLYDLSTTPLSIVAVLHASQDLDPLLLMRVSQYDGDST